MPGMNILDIVWEYVRASGFKDWSWKEKLKYPFIAPIFALALGVFLAIWFITLLSYEIKSIFRRRKKS